MANKFSKFGWQKTLAKLEKLIEVGKKKSYAKKEWTEYLRLRF